MPKVRTVTEIEATPEQVWGVLTDYAAYPDWNPIVTSMSGELREGAKQEMHVTMTDGRKMTFHPTVKALEAGRRIRWTERKWVPWIFDSDHVVELHRSDGGTRVERGESYRGVMVLLMWRMLGPKIQQGFDTMDAALKDRVEQLAKAG